MDNHNPPHEILDSLKEYFVDELKEILLAYEREDREEVHSLVSEIDRYSHAELMLKKSSNKEKSPFIEEDLMWKKYKARFLSEGYKENSVDVLTAIFYWDLDRELKNLPKKESDESKSQRGNHIRIIRKYLGYFFVILGFIFIFLHYFIRASDGNFVYDIWGLRIPQPNPNGFFVPYFSSAIRLILENISLHGLVGILGTLTLFSLGFSLVDNKSANDK